MKLNDLKYFKENLNENTQALVMTNGHRLFVSFDSSRGFLILKPEYPQEEIKLFGDNLQKLAQLISNINGDKNNV